MSKKRNSHSTCRPEKRPSWSAGIRRGREPSITAFIERAVDFYLDYLSANSAGLFLPTSIKSYLDGRMGQLEGLSSIAFRQAVEQDMVAGILADAYQFSGEDLHLSGGRRAFKMYGKPMAASRWSNGCVMLGRRTMSGRIDCEEPLSLKCGGGSSVSGYLRYIGTRERVEILTDDRPPTRKQEQPISKLTKDFPEARELGEYSDYKRQAQPRPMPLSLSTRALEENWSQVQQSDGYMKYIATRPRAERLGDHGLFGDEDAVDLEQTMQELDQYNGKCGRISSH